MPPPVVIRAEAPGDLDAIRAVHTAAFAGPAEARIVDALRDAGALALSLVARDPTRECIVGHVAFSPITVDGADIGALGLAPVGVLPSHQRLGVGGALCRAGLARARDAGFRACVVLGHAAYYPRFGFRPAPATWGLVWEGGHDESFFALELVDGALAAPSPPHASAARRVVRYRPEIA